MLNLNVTMPPPAGPVSPRQARLALIEAGIYGQVQAAIAASSPTIQVWWEFASTIDRHNPLLGALAQQLGLTDADIDQLFALAATL